MVPEFAGQYLAFCDRFVDIYKQKTCLALTKNLKFFEFYQKQLMASIDLAKTCLSNVKEALEKCKGSNQNGKWCSADGAENNSCTNDVNICFGKYVFHSLNVMKVYIIVQCWDKCVILQRLPDFQGFIVQAEYEDFRNFRIVHGPIKYSPMMELEFRNDTIIRTDFEDECKQEDLSDFVKRKTDLKQLLDRVRSAKTELQLHKEITAHSFERLQNRLTYGPSCVRSLKLEEKQMLARCGDIWKRLSPHDNLVIGIPLVNQCAPPNLTILHNLQPFVEVSQCSQGNSICFEYRLFQLKKSFNELDSVDIFLQSEDEHLQANVWGCDTKCQLLPESFVILLVMFKTSHIVSLKQCPLLLHYEVCKDYYTSANNIPLQTFLGTIDFYEILFQKRSKYELTFQPESLQQDFLTIAMSSLETCLEISFEHSNDLEIFENCLQQKFDFEKLPTFTEDSLHHIVFYNHRPNSLWFGCLSLRYYETEENEHGHCMTSWKFYCPTGEKMALFVKMLLIDLITLQCRIVSIKNMDKKLKDAKRIGDFENALRQELNILKQLTDEHKPKEYFEKWSKLFIEFCKAQMKSDILMEHLQ